ncbi:MAG: dTMP kinase [Steroidobacteraceae bacterium]
MSARSGLFLTFEGVEGVGKSTQARLAAEFLRSRGIQVVETREPGGTAVAERIRDLVLHGATSVEPLTPRAELLLMFAARAQHLAAKIEPALAAGQWVICDRFTDATEAYQGSGRGLGSNMIRQLEDIAQGTRRPDLTLLLDADPAVTGPRRSARGGAQDRFEREDEAFFARVRAGYLEIARREPGRVRLVDASGPLGTVQQRIETVLIEALEARTCGHE